MMPRAEWSAAGGRARGAALAALMLGASTMLSGCIAAAVAVPIAASGAMARQQIDGSGERNAERGPAATPTPQPGAAPAPVAGVQPFNVVGVINGPLPVPGAPLPATAPEQAQGKPPQTMQYLYGSGEAAAMSLQAYNQLWIYLRARAQDRKAGLEIRSVVLSREGSLEIPRFVPCGTKPLAVVFDIDETVLLNLGYEANDALLGAGYDDRRWRRWEQTGADKVAPVPGAVETIEEARRSGIVVVYNSNRSQGSADQTIAALEHAGLGTAKLGETLWLRGDGPNSSGKDVRRWEIAEKYCVVALVGDQLGDFTDLFNPGGVPVPIRRNMASQTMIAALWGSGWFLLPNPVYGTGLHGSLDDVFPRDKRWTDPGEAPPPPPAPTPVPLEIPQ